MPFLLTPYAAALALATVVSGTVLVVAWRRRQRPGGAAFALMMTGVLLWTGFASLGAAATDTALKVRFSQLMYVGTSLVPPLFLLFAWRFRRPDRPVSVAAAAALWVAPLMMVIAAATNEWHRLLWSSIDPSPIEGSNLLVYSHGPWYFVWTLYALVVTLTGTIILLSTVLGPGRRPGAGAQTALVVAGTAVPWLGVGLYLSPVNPWPGLDLVVLSFVVAGLLFVWAMTRLRLLDVVPVARSILFAGMPDGLLVLDGSDRVADLNPAAAQLFSVGPEMLGEEVTRLPGWRQLVNRPWGPGEERIEAPFPGDPPRFLDLRVTPLTNRRGRLVGRLIVVRDITTRRQVEQERERLIVELQNAVSDIRTLRGLLPICAGCKKIRDDRGYWRGLEQYLAEHSEATFTHGLCPECLAKYHPDLGGERSLG